MVGRVAPEQTQHEQRPRCQAAREPVARSHNGQDQIGNSAAQNGADVEIGVHPGQFITGAETEFFFHARDVGIGDVVLVELFDKVGEAGETQEKPVEFEEEAFLGWGGVGFVPVEPAALCWWWLNIVGGGGDRL